MGKVPSSFILFFFIFHWVPFSSEKGGLIKGETKNNIWVDIRKNKQLQQRFVERREDRRAHMEIDIEGWGKNKKRTINCTMGENNSVDVAGISGGDRSTNSGCPAAKARDRRMVMLSNSSISPLFTATPSEEASSSPSVISTTVDDSSVSPLFTATPSEEASSSPSVISTTVDDSSVSPLFTATPSEEASSSPSVISTTVDDSTMSPLFTATPSEEASSSPSVISTTVDDSTVSPLFTATPSEEASSSPSVISTTVDGSSVSPLFIATPSEEASSSPSVISTTVDDSTVSPLFTATPSEEASSSPSVISTTVDGSSVSPLFTATPSEEASSSPSVISTTVDDSTVSPLFTATPSEEASSSPSVISTTVDDSSVSPLFTATPSEEASSSPSVISTTVDDSTVSPLFTATPSQEASSSPSVISTTVDGSSVSPLFTATPSEEASSSPSVISTTVDDSTVSPLFSSTPSEDTSSSPSDNGTTADNSTVSPLLTTTSSGNTSNSSLETSTQITNSTKNSFFTTTPSRGTTTPTIITSHLTSSQPPLPVTQSTPKTTTAKVCMNGGSHDGIKCICPSDFYGPECEFSLEVIEKETVTVSVTVEAQVKVTNRNFSVELTNSNSEEYQNFKIEFEEKMGRVYGDIPGYHGVVIFSLRSGSIIVDHEIIFQVQVENKLSVINSTLENQIQSVIQKLQGSNSTEKDCMNSPELCFTTSPNPIIGGQMDFNITEFCKTIVGATYANYYYPDTTTDSLRCVSNCTKGSAYAINCYHGVCRISDKGPNCNCNDRNTFWYVDNNCQTRFQKSEVGLGIGMAVLFLIAIILAVFLFRTYRRKSESRYSDGDNLIYEDTKEEEWLPPWTLNFTNEAADFHNGSQNINNGFNLSLDSVDTSVQLQFEKPEVVRPQQPLPGTYPR
nr:PREDICTED: mucin-3B [Anolis carolinensis]|eukprot:XP_008111356.2 PREDICTED: mucin-3B [Anolis carolinensis]